MALRRCQLNEEGARLKVAETFQVADEPLAKNSTVGTLSEFQDIQTEFGDLEKENNELELQSEAQKENLERELRNQERKLSIKSAKELAKLNSSWKPSEKDVDLEIITDEDRECLRKIGLKLKRCLVLGEGKTAALVPN
ncbi:hypothetical protein REPUB_Repub17cG0003200 [Reevesia pubescens]